MSSSKVDFAHPENGEGKLHRVSPLRREMSVGFSGGVLSGLLCSPDSKRAFYPLGSSVVSRGLFGSGQQVEVAGEVHVHRVSCLHLSEKTGSILATGEEHQIGTKVRVVIWDAHSRALVPLGCHRLHHARVAAVRVSSDDALVASAAAGEGGGGGAPFVIWDVAKRAPLCVGKSSFSRPFAPTCLTFLPGRSDAFLAAGSDGVQVWRLYRQYEIREEEVKGDGDEEAAADVDPGAKLVSSKHVGMGKLKRNISCMMICSEEDSDYVVCGTDSGDLLKFVLTYGRDDDINLAMVGCAIKKVSSRNGADQGQKVMSGKFQGGVKCLVQMGSREYLIGSGDGSVTLVRDLIPKISLNNKENKNRRKSNNVITNMVGEPTKSSLREIKSSKFEGSVTSICKLDGGSALLVGTSSGDAHQLDLMTFNSNLLSTCHGGSINDLAFPQGLDGILGTCAQDGIRLWSLAQGQQLLHIRQQGALCLTFFPDGSCILCGFEDGCVRSYTPESGRLIGCTQGAHPQGGVSALTLLGGGRYALTGGVSGHVRSWEVNRRSGNLRLLATVRDHKGRVRSLQVTQDQKEFLSGSADGFCIIWDATDLASLKRKRILTCTASLLSARYHPSGCQVLTLSTDGQLSYWETVTGEEIRAVNVDKHRACKAMDIDKNGERIVVGAEDSTAKIWRYRQGSLSMVGRADCGPITKVAFSPSGNKLAAATADGGIVVWGTV